MYLHTYLCFDVPSISGAAAVESGGDRLRIPYPHLHVLDHRTYQGPRGNGAVPCLLSLLPCVLLVRKAGHDDMTGPSMISRCQRLCPLQISPSARKRKSVVISSVHVQYIVIRACTVHD